MERLLIILTYPHSAVGKAMPFALLVAFLRAQIWKRIIYDLNTLCKSVNVREYI